MGRKSKKPEEKSRTFDKEDYRIGKKNYIVSAIDRPDCKYTAEDLILLMILTSDEVRSAKSDFAQMQ